MREEPLKTYEIRWLRRAMGLTQVEFGKFFSRDAATIFRWENGEYEPDPASSAALLMLYNDIEHKLDETGLSTEHFLPSRDQPDDWKDFVGNIMVLGIFLYLLSKIGSE